MTKAIEQAEEKREENDLKPTSKIIQISTVIQEGWGAILTALCEDGSLWEFNNLKWRCLFIPEKLEFWHPYKS